MALFPVFMDLSGRKCICIGGGSVAARKIRILLAFDADVTVISPKVDRKLEELGHAADITIVKREYRPGDLEGAFLAIAATQSREVNRQIHAEALRRNILVNVADSPEECTFTFPSVVKRDDLVIGITTSGSYPAFSKRVRERIEELYPEYYGNVLKALKEFRGKVLLGIPDADQRKHAMDEMLDEVFRWGERLSEEQLLQKLNKLYEV